MTGVITGNLARTPFAHLILYVREHALSGTLAVWPAGTSDDAMATGSAPERADRLYFSAGARKKGRLTEVASSLDRGLLALFQRLDGPFVFYPDADYVGDGETVQLAVSADLALIAASTRGPVRDDVIDVVLSRFASGPVRLRSDADLRGLELLPREQVVLDVLRSGPAPIADLIASGGMEPRAARKVLYLLAITKAIEPFDPMRQSAQMQAARAARDGQDGSTLPRPANATPLPRPATATPRPRPANATPLPRPAATAPGAPPAAQRGPRAAVQVVEAPPPAPSELTPEQRALWDDLCERARKLDEQNFFEMLGVTSDMPGEKARDSYFELVKRLHPDRLPPPLAPLHQLAQRVFSMLTDAHDTLVDQEKRLRYIGIVKDGGGTPAAQRKLEQTIEGTVEFQKAEVLRKSDAGLAEQHARRAIELDPDQADYYALLAWILFEQHPGDGAPLDEMLALVDKAITMHDKHPRAHYYRGAVLRRIGREDDAIRAFQRAVEFNPKHVDALREVRLAGMRAKKGGGRAAAPATAGSASATPPSASSAGTPEAPKTGAQMDVGEFFKGLFGSKKK